MNRSKILSSAVTALLLLTAASLPAHAQASKGKILVVLSSETSIPLAGGKSFPSGYYLNELVIPAQKFTDAGYELVFADPKGNVPSVDSLSLSADYFGGSQDALKQAEDFRETLKGLQHPLTLKQVAASDLNKYKAVFVPGGPIPTTDLMASPELGEILRYFHDHKKTTVLLCHGPVALLAATNDPVAEQAALRRGDVAQASKLATGWPYKGYKMTVFSDDEEGIAINNVFHDKPLVIPQQALQQASGDLLTATAWHPQVVQDRELITGQNPASDTVLADRVIKTLASQQ